jgi:pimeloyl-ACP methyl ester carboxylesterase
MMPTMRGYLTFAAICMLVDPAAQAQGQGRSFSLSRLQQGAQFERVFGQRMAFYEAGVQFRGKGPTIILVPHLGWDAHMYASNLPALAARYHIIAVDPIGFGLSDKPLLEYRMDTWSDTFAEFARQRGISRIVIGGIAMGGALGVQTAMDYPDLVAGVIVAASNSGPGEHKGAAPRTGPYDPSLSGIRAYFIDHLYDDSRISDELVRERLEFRMRTNDGYTMQRHLADHRPPYSPQELARVKAPTLLPWCREDTITPLSWGKDFARALPRGTLAVLDQCGHLPNIERPAQFNAAVMNFMDKLPH